MSKILFLFILCIFLTLTSFSQINKRGIPLTRYYSPKEYNAHANNWSIAQDNRGIMYFGNNDNGVLEYDGNTWRQIEIPNHLTVRSLAKDKNGTIYVGTVNEIGFLSPDKSGNMKYISLSAFTDTSNLKNVWKILTNGDSIYYCSQKKINKYTKQKSFDVFPLQKTSFWSFNVGNTIYVGNYKNGLMKLEKNGSGQIDGGDFFAEKSITYIQQIDKEKLVVATMENGIFIFNTEDKSVVPLPFLQSGYNLYSGCNIADKNFALGSINDGVFIANESGIQEKLTRKMGLPVESVTNVFYNSDANFMGNLWMTFLNGLSKAELNSPIRKLDSEFGLNGDIGDIIRFKGVLYVATLSGIYYLEFDKQNLPVFKQVPDVTNALKFLIYKNKKNDSLLLAGTNYGLYEVNKSNVHIIEKNDENVFDLLHSKSKPDQIYLATVNGIKIIKYNNGSWTKSVKLNELTQEVRQINEDIEGNIWAATLFNGIYKIDTSLNSRNYGTKEGLPSLVDVKTRMIDNKVVFLTSGGFYKYDKPTDKIISTDYYGKKYTDGKIGIIDVYPAYNNMLWLSLYKGNKKWIEILTKQKDGKYTSDSVAFKRFPNMSTWVVYNEPDGISWLGTTEGLFSFDNNFKKNYKPTYYALIRNVIIGEDSLLFNGTFFKKNNVSKGTFAFDSLLVSMEQPDVLKPVLQYKNNNLTFIFASPFFEDESSNQFSRYLEGNDEGWSKWTKETKAIYTNLSEGKYTFHVKAKNIYGNESKVASYSFTIKPPWYRTVWAYISYVVFLIIFIWAIVSIATRRMKQLNIAYGRYLPGSFLKLLDKARVIDLRLGDLTEKEVTIMFSDIRSYTNLSESMSPHDNFRFLVSYLSKIGDMLHQNTGFPVQYYGDGIMAMFHGDTDNAVKAAIDMHNKVAEYSADRITKERRPLHIGVGLHTGKIVMGIRGDERRWEGGIVGDSVNLAARMEGLTKMYGASTMLTDDTFKKLKNPKKFNIRFLGKVKVKGKDIPVGIYELLDGNDPHVFELKMKSKTNFDAALDYYFEKDLEKAKELFLHVLEVNPDDIAASHYVETIKHYLTEGVPADWDGVEKLDKK